MKSDYLYKKRQAKKYEMCPCGNKSVRLSRGTPACRECIDIETYNSIEEQKAILKMRRENWLNESIECATLQSII